ncbi:MAG TPA: SRPBCC domain-containing protein [Polyangiaceae bacterium]|jgi:uncharacterized protein YndB with AHSA1/START domain|nr:SRPBCC domain-containing protein [Polyangiaceae bacterium]
MTTTTTGKAAAPARRSTSDIHLVREYPHSPEKIWRLLVDPALIPLWTSTGQGGRPVGFSPVVGTRFKYVAKPMPGWNGIVECEVLEVGEPTLLRYTWLGGEKDDLTTVTNLLEPHGRGTRFTWDHTGFTGIGGFIVSRVLNRVRKKMLDVGFPAVLADLDDEGKLRPGSSLKPKP